MGAVEQERAAGMAGATAAEPAVRIGVIGVGRIGRMHAELLAHRVAGASLAAIHDSAAEAAATIGDELGVPVVADVEEMLAAPEVDAVAICTSTDTHPDLIAAAAGAGKAVFCEKPLSLDLAELDRALAAVAEAAVPFQIGFNRRFDPAHQSVRDAVASGAVGEPYLVRITSRDPTPPSLEYVKTSGGLFLDMMIHDFDMARYVTGSEVVEVYARGALRVAPEFAEAGDVDTAIVTLAHESGCLTAIDNCRQAAYGFDQRVEVLGSRGVAASENPLAHTGVVRTADGSRTPALPHFFLERYIPSYIRAWDAFLAVVRAGEPAPGTRLDARAPLVIGLAASRSLHEGRPVAVSEVEA
jgi:myo-inositol 2-dehydrogenase / D-chiro-inositol 1-dehydrogenase